LEKDVNKFILNNLILILVVGLLAILCGQESPKGNEVLLEELFIQPLMNAVDSNFINTSSTQIVLKEQNDFNYWIRNRLSKYILSKGITLYDSLKQDNLLCAKIIIEKVESHINYRGIKKDFLLRNSKYEREILGVLTYYIKDKEEIVLQSDKLDIKYVDIVDGSDIKTIEKGLYQFTKGEKKESKFLKRFFEPLLITVTTVTVVYLFYSQRSG
jgi:hypothetical protein